MRKILLLLVLIFVVILSVSCSLRGNDGDFGLINPVESDKSANQDETINNLPPQNDESATEQASDQAEVEGTEPEIDVNIPSTNESEESTTPPATEGVTTVPETDETETTPSETDSVNTDPTEKKEYVFEFVNQKDSSYGSYPSGDAWYLMYTMRIPRVEVSSDIDDAVNEEILNRFYYPALDKISQKKAAFDINYRVYINDDILSLLIVNFESIGDVGYTVYTVTINTSTKSILTLSELAKYQNRDYASLFDGLEDPSEELFYINDRGELILIDLRLKEAGDSEKQYFLYNVDSKNENNDFEELKQELADDHEDYTEPDIDSATSESLINEAYLLLKTSSYSVAKNTAVIRRENKDEVNNIQVVFETDDENVRVAVNFYRTKPGAEWKILPGVPISVYDRTRWSN